VINRCNDCHKSTLVARCLEPILVSTHHEHWSSCVSESPVLEPEQKLRHLPFFEEVASHEEGDVAWRSATAGLVVLRLVDAWLENGRSVVADDGWSVRSVRAAIESMDEGTPHRSILGRVMDALHEQKPDIH